MEQKFFVLKFREDTQTYMLLAEHFTKKQLNEQYPTAKPLNVVVV